MGLLYNDIDIPACLEDKETLTVWLKNRFFDGLYFEDCACCLDDLHACGEGYGSCHPGFKIQAHDAEVDYYIVSPEEFKSRYDRMEREKNEEITNLMDEVEGLKDELRHMDERRQYAENIIEERNREIQYLKNRPMIR